MVDEKSSKKYINVELIKSAETENEGEKEEYAVERIVARKRSKNKVCENYDVRYNLKKKITKTPQ